MSPELRDALARARSVRFVCSGNMVRSAFAELYARHIGCSIEVDSAATTYQNDGLYPDTRRALAALGIAPRTLDAFRPRRLERIPVDELGAERVVFGMTPEHLDAYAAHFGLREPCFLLSELLGRSDRIDDPVLDGVSFDVAFGSVGRCVDVLVEGLATRGF